MSSSLVIGKQSKFISSAREAYKYLHGTINVYKPAGVSVRSVIRTLKMNLSEDLSLMEIKEPAQHVRIGSADNKNFEVKLVPNLARHALVMGPEFPPESFRIISAHKMSINMSGVLSINKGTKWASQLRQGTATDSCFGDGRVVARATHGHVTTGKLQAFISSMQATYQRQMFALSGIHIQAQTAYELACKGLIRPKEIEVPMIYEIRSTGNVGKTFTLEEQALNVDEQYLSEMINKIGIHLRTAAHCMKIRCTRVGFFSYKDSLLRSQWNLQNVIQSMHECQQIWNRHPSMVSQEISIPVGQGLNTMWSEDN